MSLSDLHGEQYYRDEDGAYVEYLVGFCHICGEKRPLNHQSCCSKCYDELHEEYLMFKQQELDNLYSYDEDDLPF